VGLRNYLICHTQHCILFMIQIRDLVKQYPQTSAPIIDKLSLEVDNGTSVSIRGASGCGKSTLLSLMAGFEPADAGQIHIGTATLPFASGRQGDAFRRNELGVIFQSYNLLDCLNVWDNIAFTARLKGVTDKAYLRRLMAMLGISELSNKSASALSGGEQQRVAIARALAHRPAVVLADEPTGNLDETTSETVTQALYTTCTELNTTLVVVTHSNEVAEQANRPLWLRHGVLHSHP